MGVMLNGNAFCRTPGKCGASRACSGRKGVELRGYGGNSSWDERVYGGGVGGDVLPEGAGGAGAAYLLRDAV